MLWEVPEKREKLKELDHASLKCIMNNNINCYLILFWWIKYCVSEMLHYEMLCATCHNFVGTIVCESMQRNQHALL